MYSDSISKLFRSPCFPTFRPLIMSTWSIAPIKTPTLIWGEHKGHHVHQCPYCSIPLLTGEHPGFCCGKNGQYVHDVPPLPPLPAQYNSFVSDHQISSLSCILNLIFSFASLETTLQFPQINGPPGFLQLKVVSITECARAIQTLLSIGFYMTASYVIKFHIHSGLH